MVVLLTRRAVLQGAIESSYDTEATLTNNDAFLVEEPTYTADPTVLERDFVRNSLSQQAHIVGRMIAKMEFTTELRGNGKQNSGVIGDAPLIARLFRACGYALTGFAAANTSNVFEVGDHANAVSWAKGGTLTGTEMVQYHVKVTTGGPSTTARVAVTSDVAGEGSSNVTVTSGSPISLGTKGATITPTFTGSLVAGQAWTIWLRPAGLQLKPISDNFESLTLRMNKDGVVHLMPGSYGSFEITANAGEYAKVKWTFWGTFREPTDGAIPTPNYETTLPAQVEQARLRLDDFAAVVEKFSYNQSNDVQIRPDVNGNQGYIGTRIVSRSPEGGIDPEADLVASHDFWGNLRKAKRMSFQVRFGTVAGNRVYFLAPKVQYTRATYADRSGILTYDAGLKFSGDDDEVFLYLA